MIDHVSIRRSNPKLVGMEIFEIKPILLGGDPVDPQNKTMLTRQQHIEAVRYWNNMIRKIRKEQEKR
ncbi:hypothetical protein ACN9MJ_13085 [Acidovorax facilis]|uniref:hypothetical protein n=1 Tax=Acidovorax facilis TaxID=12917 RepID=UPI003CEFD84E